MNFLVKLFSSKIPRNFALIGPPGTGKTFTLCLYVDILVQAFQNSKNDSEVQGVIFEIMSNIAIYPIKYSQFRYLLVPQIWHVKKHARDCQLLKY